VQLIIALVDQLDGVAVARLSGPVKASHTIVVSDPKIRSLFDDGFK
jgi:hypothetical protein